MYTDIDVQYIHGSVVGSSDPTYVSFQVVYWKSRAEERCLLLFGRPGLGALGRCGLVLYGGED